MSLFLLAALSGCAEADTAAPAGAQAVSAPETGIAPLDSLLRSAPRTVVDLDRVEPVPLEPDLILGGEPEPEDALFLAEPLDLIVRGDSTYIVDAQQHAILVADRSGQLVRRIGREGEGPGEFLDPMAITQNDALIYVYDNGNGRVQVFDEQFRLQATISQRFLPPDPLAATQSHLAIPLSFAEIQRYQLRSAYPPFEEAGRFLPRLIPPGEQPLAFNSLRLSASTRSPDMYATYLGLPYVFALDEAQGVKQVLLFEGAAVDALDNPIPERIRFSGGNSGAVREFITALKHTEEALYVLAVDHLYVIDPATYDLRAALQIPSSRGDARSHLTQNLYVTDDHIYIISRVTPTIFVYSTAHLSHNEKGG